MLHNLENCLSNYPNVINLLIAMGTIGAVITSLYYSNLKLKPKIKANLYCSEILYPIDNKTYKKSDKNEFFISLNLLNKGLIPIYIPYLGGFSWIFVFTKIAWLQAILEPKDSEIEITPYKSKTFIICKYKDFVNNIKQDLLGKKKYNKFFLRFLSLKIRTLNNEIITIKPNKILMHNLLKDV